MKHAFKKTLAMLLVLVMVIGLIPSVFAAKVAPFTDVDESDWFAPYVKYVYEHEPQLMNGTAADRFEPEGNCTRAMAAVVIYRLADPVIPSVKPSSFVDLTEDWYKNGIAWAEEHGVVNGVGDNRFDPDGLVTREQLVTMLWRYAGEPKVTENYLKDFPDADKIASYAKEAFNWAISMKIIGGSDGKLLPRDNATRAEFAKIITVFAKATAPCEHVWDEGKVTKEPTCTEKGEKVLTCKLCGATKTVEIPAKGHTWDEGKVTTEPTCTEKGVKTFTCTVCGETKTEEVAALGHIDENNDGICDRCGENLGTEPVEGKVVIYYPKDGKVMTTESYTYTNSNNGSTKDELVGAAATVTDGKVVTDATNAAEFEMVTVDGVTTFKTADGKYLYADGTNVRLVDTEDDNTKFVIEEATDGVYLRCANATYNGNAQYIEVYGGYFTVYKFDSAKSDIYTFQLLPLSTGTTPDPDDPEPEPTGEEFVLTSELKEGDEVIIVCTAKNIALGADYGSSYYNPGVEVAPADGKLVNSDATIVWTVGKEGEFYTFSYNGKKIGMGTEYTSMPLDGVNYKWQVEPAATAGSFYVKNLDRDTTKPYYMQWYESNGYWSGYHTLNEELMALSFYVKKTDTPEPTGGIAILYTNDVHTYIGGALSYDNLADLKAETAKTADGVLLLDAGDHVQGTAYGSMDEGKTIISLMNAAGYDAATLGNHEFDYGMARTLEIIEEANYPYLSCNFYHEDHGMPTGGVLDGFKIFEVGGKKVAVVGITTPESFTKSTPKYFQDENGNYIYGIAGGTDGAMLYSSVQAAVDAATRAGADYVIALGHCGDDPASKPWTSEEVIANTTGLDAFIDGHSHSTVPMKEVKDKNGETVILTQTGSYFGAVGKLTITADGITAELITAHEGSNADVKAIKDAWMTEIDTKLGEVIGKAEITLDNYDAEGNRLVRRQETNTGDFAADALYYLFDNMDLDVDLAIMNGGGVRNKAITGDISYKTCKEIHTFGNVACLITVTGQQILDALEWGARAVGKSSDIGGFLHVSGVTYEIHTYIDSTVQMDEKGVWTGGPTGEYRVKNVTVGGEPLDLTKTYNMAGYNYTLRDLGDGFAMFDGATNVLDYVMEDYLVLANYVKSFPAVDGVPTIKADNSVLGANYAEVTGEGRITVVSVDPAPCDHEWDEGKVTTEPTCTEEGVKTFTCSKCGETKTEAVEALGHTDTDNDHLCDRCGLGDYGLVSELQDGDKVIIYNTGRGKAIKNETDRDWYLLAEPVTPADGTISTADTTIVWTATKNEDGTFTFTNGENAITAWLSVNGTKSYVELTNNAAYEGADTKWNVAACNAENHTYFLSSSSVSTSYGPGYIECYLKDGVDKMTGYATNTPAEGDFSFQFYVLGAEPAHVHTWNDGEVTKEATCTEDGVKTYTCTDPDCGATKTEVIKALGHIDEDPADGKCDRCGADMAPVTTSSFVKVTAAPTDWSGTYLIVYESSETEALVFNGKDEANGYVAATIDGGKITATTELNAVTVVVEAVEGGYTIKVGGQYIYGTSGSNKLNFAADAASAGVNTFAMDTDGVLITSNTSVLRFNATSNNMRFHYYKSSSYTGQKPVQLYKLTEG